LPNRVGDSRHTAAPPVVWEDGPISRL